MPDFGALRRLMSATFGQRKLRALDDEGSRAHPPLTNASMDLTRSDRFVWQHSPAHLMLLSKCLEAKAIDNFDNLAWREALKEPADKAIDRLWQDGMLVTAELPELVKYRFKVNEIKAMLKQRALPISGRKDELVGRLVLADSEAMRTATNGLSLVTCSERGRSIAEQYIAAEKTKRAQLEDDVLDLIHRRMFAAASNAVAAYEAAQPLPRGIGIDWANHDPARDVAILQFIWVRTPKILSRVDESRLTALRMGASMSYLLGESASRRSLPPDLPGCRMDATTAARMFMFHATHTQNIENYRQSGVVFEVQILATQTSCEACREIDGQQFSLAEVIELPYQHCTHAMGCRCVVVAVADLPGVS